MRHAFTLDPGTVHLNHGSFGAVPRVVQEEQRRVRDRADANPLRFHRVELPERIERARHVAARMLGAGASELALVRNVTEATTTVVATLAHLGRLGPGEVVLVNDHGYGAVRLCLEQWCRRFGATLETVHLPLSCEEEDVVARHRAALDGIGSRGDRVALVVVDAVTSPTGARLPVSRLTGLAREAGAYSFVDAAHAPGHLEASPTSSGADFWAGAFHKWGFAPRGTSALWVAEPLRDRVQPPITSWNRDEPFPANFDWHGTDDYSGWLCLDAAVRFWGEAGGFGGVRERRDMVEQGRSTVTDAVVTARDVEVPDAALPRSPAPCLRLVPLPGGVADAEGPADALYHALSARGVEAQVLCWGGRGYVRLSAAPYNEPADYGRLADLLAEMLR
jgi:isopenicillin-N epimerase